MIRNTILFLFLLVQVNCWSQVVETKQDIHHLLIQNKGQWPKGVLFQSKLEGGNLWIEEGRFLYHLWDRTEVHAQHGPLAEHDENFDGTYRESFLEVVFEGGNKNAAVKATNPSANHFSYFIGNDSSKWATGVLGFGIVERKDFYPSIDFKMIQSDEKLKYEFIIKKGGKPADIRMKYTGAKSLKLDRSGNLNIETALGRIIEEKPYVYQIVNGKIIQVESSFEVKDLVVTFKLGSYNKELDLIIDPILVFATYAGAIHDNFGMTATYGYDGTAYSGGMLFGNNYPSPDPLSLDSSSITTNTMNTGITDVFVSRYSSDGTQMLWSAFLGGGNNTTGTETVHSLICDSNNVLYLYGVTSSNDFPVLPNAFQKTFGGGTSVAFSSNGTQFNTGTDIYVAKISADGTQLLGSTYIGGSGNDGINNNENPESYDSIQKNYGDQFRGEIMLGPNRQVIVGTSTRSSNFPTKNPLQNTLLGKQDGIIFSMDNDLTSLNFSTYFGGIKKDAIFSLKVDSSFNIIFAGGTSSDTLPATLGKFSSVYGGGKSDGFIGKITLNGSAWLGTTFTGFDGHDVAFAIYGDRNNNIFITGQGESGKLPVLNAPFSVAGSAMFILKFNEDLTTLLNATTFGKTNSNLQISPTAFLVDRCGEIYVSGWGANLLTSTPLSDFPTTNNAFQSNPGTRTTFYLIVIDRTFGQLIYGSYIGDYNSHDHVDGGTSRFDQKGIVYQSICGGCSSGSSGGPSSTFPTTPGAWSNSNLSGNCNNIVFKFDFQTVSGAEIFLEDTTVCLGASFKLKNNSTGSDEYYWDFGNGQTSTEFEPTVSFQTPGTYTIQLIVKDSVCRYSDTTQIVVVVGEPLLSLTPDTLFSCGVVDTVLIPVFSGSPTFFHWSSNPNFTDTLNNYPSDSSLQISIQSNRMYYLNLGDTLCNSIDSVLVFNLKDAQILIPAVTSCDDTLLKIKVENTLPMLSGITHKWSPDSIIVGPNNLEEVVVEANTSQYLYLTTTTPYGCVLKDSVKLTINKLADLVPTISANPTLLPQGGFTQLSASGGSFYTWTPEEGIVNPEVAITKAKVNKNTTYQVNVSDGFCSKDLSVDVFVFEFRCDEVRVFVPNAFTPNGDKENDVLYVRSEVIEFISLKIFTRWGELIFETTDLDSGWDGTFKGKTMDPDVYDYYLEAGCVDGQKFFNKGNITLIR